METCLGEKIVEELLQKKYKYKVKKPKKKGNFKPDFETEDCIWEVKTRNYTTTGTAGEKILGTPLKYIDVPTLYKKKLCIVLVGYQEYEAIHSFQLFSPTGNKKKLLDYLKTFQIEYIKASSLL